MAKLIGGMTRSRINAALKSAMLEVSKLSLRTDEELKIWTSKIFEPIVTTSVIREEMILYIVQDIMALAFQGLADHPHRFVVKQKDQDGIDNTVPRPAAGQEA